MMTESPGPDPSPSIHAEVNLQEYTKSGDMIQLTHLNEEKNNRQKLMLLLKMQK